MIVRIAIILIFLSSFIPNVFAGGGLLTWEQCVREAAENNPDLSVAWENVNQAEEDKAITRSSILPQISSDLSGRRSGADDSADTKSFSYGISARQLLFDGFKASSNIKAAEATLNASQYGYAVASSDVRFSLRSAFAGLLRAQELVSITREIASRRDQNLKLVKLRYEAGREHEGSLLTAQADLAQARFEVDQAERNLILAQRELLTDLGRQEFTPIKVAGDFEAVETEQVKPDLENLAQTTPFLKELSSRKEAVRQGVKSARADFFPQIYLSGSMGRSAAVWPPEDDSWSAGVSLSFPLFEGGSRVANVSRAESRLEQAEARERGGRDTVIFTLEKTWTQYQDAIDRVSVQQRYLRAAETRAKIANAQYSNGLISFNDWIIIEDNLVNRKKAFLDSRANLLIAEAGWIQAKGGILEYEE